MKDNIKEFEKYKHKPHYPVRGGAKVCSKCGEQNYETEYCSINIDWNMEKLKTFLLKALQQKEDETYEKARTVTRKSVEEARADERKKMFGIIDRQNEDTVYQLKDIIEQLEPKYSKYL